MTQRQPPACPECERLSEVANESNRIGDFLDYFLNKKGLHLARYEEVRADVWNEEERERVTIDEMLVPASEYRGESGISRLLAEYYGIDLDKVEQERKALLDWIREQNQ